MILFLHSKKEVDKKNVRKVLTRLFELGIIEIVEGAYPHNAKPYRLTTAGLFGYLLHVHFMPYVLKQYEDNILFETLPYRFMERDTLEYFHSIYRIELLKSTLRDVATLLLCGLDSMRARLCLVFQLVLLWMT